MKSCLSSLSILIAFFSLVFLVVEKVDFVGKTEHDAQTAPTVQALPSGLPIITTKNAHKVVQLSVWKHDGSIIDVAWSHDGNLLAVTGSMGTWLYSFSSSGGARRLLGNGGRRVAFATNTNRLAFSDWHDVVHVWDTSTSKEQLTLVGHTAPIDGIAFSPDGTMLASGDWNNRVYVWDVSTGAKKLTIQVDPEGSLRDLAFSPAGKILAGATGNTNSVQLWEVSTGKLIATLNHGGWVEDVDFDPSGQIMASCGNGSIRLWDVKNDTLKSILKDFLVYSIAFNKDETLLASGRVGDIILWDAKSYKGVSILEGHTAEVLHVAFNSDGTILASGSADGSVRLWGVH